MYLYIYLPTYLPFTASYILQSKMDDFIRSIRRVSVLGAEMGV